MNPRVLKLIMQLVEALCILLVAAVTISDSVKKDREQKK